MKYNYVQNYKRMKINSSTHMTILVTFALVFVVIYLYYTITDVRKMSVELKKASQDIQTLSTSVAKLSNDVVEIQKMGLDVNKMFNMNDMLTQELNGLISQQLTQSQPVCKESVCVTQVEQTAIEADDDDESVDTADIKKILNDDEPEPDAEPEPEVPVQEPEPVKTVKKATKKKSV